MNDKLLIDRTLLEQALDALLHKTGGSDQVQRIDAAIADLCAALAQEQTDGRVVIERRDDMLYMNGSEIGPGTLEIRRDGVTYRAAERVAVQQPEPAQEPAHDERTAIADLRCAKWLDPECADKGACQSLKFKRPPLTDEEIEDIFKHLCSTVGASYKTMARAIERKVRGE